MSFEEIVVGYHSRLYKISKLDMNDDFKVNLLLKHVNLDSHDRNLVIRAAGGDYSIQPLATGLKNAFRSEELPPSSISAAARRHRHPPKPIPNNDKGYAQLNARAGHNSVGSALNGHIFYTYLTSDNINHVPRAMNDSGS